MVNVSMDDLLKVIGAKEVELQLMRQENATLKEAHATAQASAEAYQNTIAVTEAEVMRLRNTISSTSDDDAPAG